nr:hypothetical protein [Tanacetum cinerariifolium]
MLKSFPLTVMKFPLPEYFPTASEEMFPLLSQKDAPAEEVCTVEKLKVNRDEHFSTISKTKSDELIKSSVENLVPIPSEYEVTSNNKSECDVPVKDEYSPIFTTFSNPLFDCNNDFTSSDDESLPNEDVPMENFKIYLNPIFDDEEILSNKIYPHYFNAESNPIESLPNRDTLFDSSPKFNYLEEFSGELMPTSIINEECIRREHEEYISLMEKLLTINSTLPTSPIPVEDSDSLREEINIFTSTNDLIPPGIESGDYDSEEDIHFLEELLRNDSIPLPENESSDFYHHDEPSFPFPPPEPPDVEIFFDFEPNLRELISAVINNIDELNEDECFDPGGGDEHFSTIPKTKSDELIKSSVENLVPIPSEYEVTSNNENTLFDSSPKFNYLEEFSGKLMPTSIINEECIRREHEEYISLMEKLLTI